MGTRFFFRLKEKFFKYFFIVEDVLLKLLKWVSSFCNLIILLCGFLFMTLMIARLGFSHHQVVQDNVDGLVRNILFITYFAKYTHDLLTLMSRKVWTRWVDLGLFVVATIVMLANTSIAMFAPLADSFLSGFASVTVVLCLIFISDFYKVAKVISSIKMSPPLLFAFSFLIMIFIGSGLFMLPNVHTGEISYFEALFTSVSTICVSGLSIIDLPSVLTFKGNLIALLLFQIGGLGVMAFTGLFAFAFTGTVSFKDRMLLKDMFSSDAMGDVFSFLTKVLSLTLLFEAVGAVVIYLNVYESDISNPIFFSIYHSVSAFCNCGMSTLPGGFANEAVVGNYPLLMTVAVLTTLGGIGFPVMITIYVSMRYGVSRLLRISTSRRSLVKPVGSNMATNIAIMTTIGLLIVGTLGYYFLELHNTLADDSALPRWIKSFFCCATARTAGFNISEVSSWSHATMVFLIGIMWIGASPGSTGGGIKTTTFALALCSIVSFVRGNRYIEIGYHRIGFETISRVLVLVTMSLIIIFVSFIVFAVFEPDLNPLYLFFDTVSMYSTTGLSIVGTSNLSQPSQVLTMFLMFLGRVGPLTLLSGIFVSRKSKYAKYPYKNLTIN